MELVQPGGDRDFRRGEETLARLVRELPVPVVVKETGCGLSYRVGQRLRALGIRHVDVSGAGGTSWVAVETERAAHAGDAGARALGEAFRDWGIPTAASVVMMARAGLSTIIATGGIATGLEIAKAIALGATAAGIARPVLRALEQGGRDGARAFLAGVERELRAAMLLTGSRTALDLRRADRVIGADLSAWLAASPEG
jgi:isopentenyl-diphosphate delta-isomerase